MSLTQAPRAQELRLQHARAMAIPGVAALLLFAALFVSAPGAQAHAIVVESSPAANASVSRGALDVVVRFNTRVDRARSRLFLEGPAGPPTPVALTEAKTPTSIAGRGTVEKPGRWKLRWQVLAADGHITRGEIPFVVVGQ